MILNRFTGDPAINITEGGATLKFVGGQPTLDKGLHNGVLISLFTKPGWWGNTLISDPNQKIGALFEQIRTIVETSTLNEYREAARDALKWMTETGLAKKINITVTNPVGNQIHTRVEVYPPGGDIQTFIFTKNGMAWIGQALHPANERLK